MRDTNGEFVENLHSSLRTHEENHGYKVVRRLGTPSHLKLAHESLVTFNSLKAGHSPAHELMIRKSSPHWTLKSQFMKVLNIPVINVNKNIPCY